METERLVLKLYTENEKKDFVDLFTDEAVMKHVDKCVMTREQAENLWRKLFENLYAQGVNTIWAIFVKENSRNIGYAGIRPRTKKPEDWEITYVLRQTEWRKGFATEIARRLIEFGFDELNLPEIFATVDDDNFPSIHVLTKAGMSFREFDYDEQGRYSVYSIEKFHHRDTENTKVF